MSGWFIRKFNIYKEDYLYREKYKHFEWTYQINIIRIRNQLIDNLVSMVQRRLWWNAQYPDKVINEYIYEASTNKQNGISHTGYKAII